MSTQTNIIQYLANYANTDCIGISLIICFFISITYVFTVEIILPYPKPDNEYQETFRTCQSLYSYDETHDASLTLYNDQKL